MQCLGLVSSDSGNSAGFAMPRAETTLDTLVKEARCGPTIRAQRVCLDYDTQSVSAASVQWALLLVNISRT